MITTWRYARSPTTSRGEVDGDESRRSRARADRRLGAHALAGLQRGARTGGWSAARWCRPSSARLVGALDLALDLGLADDHRLQARGHAEELARGVAVARRVDDVGQLGRADVGPAGEQPEQLGLGARPGRRRRGRSRCGCRSRSRPPPARSSRRDELAQEALGLRASVSARRSRSATGAVLCEMPRASSSLIADRAPARALAACARSAQLVELGELALQRAQLARP